MNVLCGCLGNAQYLCTILCWHVLASLYPGKALCLVVPFLMLLFPPLPFPSLLITPPPPTPRFCLSAVAVCLLYYLCPFLVLFNTPHIIPLAPPSLPDPQLTGTDPRSPSTDPELHTVTLEKCPGQPLGIKLVSRRCGPAGEGVYVAEVIAGSAASQDSRLRRDDRILYINGRDVRQGRLQLACELIQVSCKGRGGEGYVFFCITVR